MVEEQGCGRGDGETKGEGLSLEAVGLDHGTRNQCTEALISASCGK